MMLQNGMEMAELGQNATSFRMACIQPVLTNKLQTIYHTYINAICVTNRYKHVITSTLLFQIIMQKNIPVGVACLICMERI